MGVRHPTLLAILLDRLSDGYCSSLSRPSVLGCLQYVNETREGGEALEMLSDVNMYLGIARCIDGTMSSVR